MQQVDRRALTRCISARKERRFPGMDKIICVGKNYLDHAQELGDAVPEMPVLFLKPPSSLFQANQLGAVLEVDLPRGKGAVHYETEIVLRLEQGKITDVTLGLDLTLRALQGELKKAGHPWELAKVFAGSALVGPWLPIKDFLRYLDTPFSFFLNGVQRQKANGHEMRLLPDQILRYAAEWFPLCDGDLVFTGTPRGVGELSPGDRGQLNWGTQTLFEVQWRP